MALIDNNPSQPALTDAQKNERVAANIKKIWPDRQKFNGML